MTIVRSTLADYLKIEEAVFAQMEREVIAKVDPADRGLYCRYSPDALVNPAVGVRSLKV